MKKVLGIFLLFFLFCINSVEAKQIKNDISSIIKDFGVDMDSLAVSIKDVKGKKLYTLNDKMLMNPASVQKMLTIVPIVETLGEDYVFETELYSMPNDEYVIKLGADPYLTSKDLKTLVSDIKPETQKISIDETVLDNKTWGEGWQWDDDMNVLMPRFGAYNLDKNLVKLTIMPSHKGQFATIINPSKYPLVFFNNIVTDDKTQIDVRRDNAVSANTLMLSGTVARPTVIYVPTVNLKGYFNIQLTRGLEEKGIYLKHSIVPAKLKKTEALSNRITHPIDIAIVDVLKNSNNLVSETLFKLAGAKYSNLETGTDSAGIKMFNDYCVKNQLDNSRIRIADASGVSKNNLISADFISEFLLVNEDNKVMKNLPKPGEGTLTHRMLPIKENLRAKTGSLSDVSAIAGYLTTKKGNKITFCIMINDVQLSSSDKKMLEDYIIREAYLTL